MSYARSFERMVKVLFVCMGNICRSPAAQGMFERLVEQTGLMQHIEVDSAGTHAYHVGHAPDPRAQASALRRGIDISVQRARRVDVQDFERFDYILAMDQQNMAPLEPLCPPVHRHKLRLFLDFVPDLRDKDVPDPYNSGAREFQTVMDQVKKSSERMIPHLQHQH